MEAGPAAGGGPLPEAVPPAVSDRNAGGHAAESSAGEAAAEPEPQGGGADDGSGYGFGSRTSSASSLGSRSSSLARAPSAPPPATAAAARPEPGTVPVLAGEDLRRAVFVSYSRRHAGALNLANVFVNCLRWHERPDGTPYSRACRDGLVVPWMDKEQMAESGGADWSRILAEAQTRAFFSVFFLSNAYCGSEECLKELQYSDMKKFARVPCFLEAFANDEDDFAAKDVATVCDADMKEWDGFEIAKNTVERLTFRLQGVPAIMDLSQFTCDECRGKRDTVCVRCTSWASVKQKACAAKLDEMAAMLGRYVDSAAVRAGFLEAAEGTEFPPAVRPDRPSPAQAAPEPEPKPPAAAATHDVYTHVCLQVCPVFSLFLMIVLPRQDRDACKDTIK